MALHSNIMACIDIRIRHRIWPRQSGNQWKRRAGVGRWVWRQGNAASTRLSCRSTPAHSLVPAARWALPCGNLALTVAAAAVGCWTLRHKLHKDHVNNKLPRSKQVIINARWWLMILINTIAKLKVSINLNSNSECYHQQLNTFGYRLGISKMLSWDPLKAQWVNEEVWSMCVETRVGASAVCDNLVEENTIAPHVWLDGEVIAE